MSQRRHAPIPLPIEEGKTEERLSKGKGIIYKRQRVLDKQKTTDNYEKATESLVFDARLYKTKTIHVVEVGGTNAGKFQVLACINPDDWSILDIGGSTEFEVTAGSDKPLEDIGGQWAYLKLQPKSSLAGNPAVLTGYIAGQTP